MNRRTAVGWRRSRRFGAAVEDVLRVAMHNPIAAMAIGAGVGWVIHSVSKKRAQTSSWYRRMGKAEEIPVLNTGHARIYDPDASPLYPTQDSLESRREMSARV